MAKPVREIPGTVTHVSADGRETHSRMAWRVLPPPKDRCQICAAKHEPSNPHNAQSIYYATIFHSFIGRSPTWADAMAHCAPAVKAAWEAELRKKNAWTEPPPGEEPVRHHGVG